MGGEYQPAVGERVVAETKAGVGVGTVRFVGEVAGSSSTRVGIEWDDPARGKHDGEVKGVRYFETSGDSKTGASLVKLKSIEEKKSLLEGIEERYGDQVGEATAADLSVRTAHGTSLSVDLKMEKCHRYSLSRLRMATVPRVGLVGDVEEIRRELPILTELDLSGALLNTWGDVAKICGVLPHLQTLRVNATRFLPATIGQLEDHHPEEGVSAFQKVKILSLNDSGMSWGQMVEVASHFPSLEELYCCKNCLVELNGSKTSTSTALPVSVKVLNLDRNILVDWNQLVDVLRVSPQIEMLMVNDNQLEKVTPCPKGVNASLYELQISGNPFQEWWDLDEITSYPKLQRMRMQRFRKMYGHSGPREIRRNTIARLHTLTVLNGCVIREKERFNAEKNYAAAQMDTEGVAETWERIRGTLKYLKMPAIRMSFPEAVRLKHRRIPELLVKYPDTISSKNQAAAATRKNVGRSILRVTLGLGGVTTDHVTAAVEGEAGKAVAAGSAAEANTLNRLSNGKKGTEKGSKVVGGITRRIPGSMKLHDLCLVMQRLRGEKARGMKVVVWEIGHRFEVLDSVMQDVEFYSVPEGAILLFYPATCELPTEPPMHFLTAAAFSKDPKEGGKVLNSVFGDLGDPSGDTCDPDSTDPSLMLGSF